MKEDDRLPSLNDLQAKINKFSKNDDSDDNSSSPSRDISQAMRMVTDLAAGVIIGVGLGYFIDIWLGTTPLMMIILLFFGVAAGVKNMIRSAAIIDRQLTEENQKKNETTENNESTT